MTLSAVGSPLEMWGGVECTVNRVGDTFRDQLVLNGHDVRTDDLERFARLGFRTMRVPVLWERVAPSGLEHADWRWSDARLAQARELGIRPIVGLVHHGSGPAGTSLLDPAFPGRLAEFARAVAERYPWVTAYTPVNEPLTTARFSALYGLWYPHVSDSRQFVRALLVQCRASILAMRSIREITPGAALVQTEDLGRTYSTPLLAYQATFDNERRWLTFDLLTGRLTRTDRMWRYMRDQGIDEETLEWFRVNACPPDLLGINHYVTSNRYLDTDRRRYPAHTWGGNGRHRYADVEAVRVLERPASPREVLLEAWQRYHLPLAVTEVHLGCTREEQLRWLGEVWAAAAAARQQGADVRAVTAWSLLGAFDWDSLLTRAAGHYEPGAFDVRGPAPRITALGRMIGDLAHGRATSHPAGQGPGWWERSGRFAHGHGETAPPALRTRVRRVAEAPLIVVTGAGGTLATAFGRVAQLRGLEAQLLSRSSLDVADPASVASALAEHRPWAVVNASGYVRVGDAERHRDICFRENALGAATLARECARLGVALVTFSSDLVFSGTARKPYVESDPACPSTVYGASKVAAEQGVAEAMPAALTIRTSAFFGPWDVHNLLTRALESLRAGGAWEVPDAVVSPTYVPDLVNAALDLLIDGERGIWHLTNAGQLSWLEFVRRGAELAGLQPGRVRVSSSILPHESRGSYTALSSERGMLLPPLENALERYIKARAEKLARAQPFDALTATPAAGA
ncbi:MAG: sugar nucleotide-binding protein [Gemmatimonadales bacterium]|nr:sugar nucleotide-binding protein [Gemmatimonadales bacterium]